MSDRPTLSKRARNLWRYSEIEPPAVTDQTKLETEDSESEQALSRKRWTGSVRGPLIATATSAVVALIVLVFTVCILRLNAEQVLFWIVLTGLTIAGAGTFLRAYAHKVDERDDLDYLGKLLALAAFAFALWSAVGRLASIGEQANWWIYVWIAVVVLAISVLIGRVIVRSKRVSGK